MPHQGPCDPEHLGEVGQCLDSIEGSPICCPPLFPYSAAGEPDDTFDHIDCWVGMKTSDFLGELAGFRGDNPGCDPCGDTFNELLEYHDNLSAGSRWLRPDPQSNLNRDASGRLHDLLSRQVHLIIDECHYIRGTGWSNDLGNGTEDEANECFGQSICSFQGINEPSSIQVPNTNHCPDGTLGGALHPGRFPDEFFYNGHRWPLNTAGATSVGPNEMYVRKYTHNRFSHENHKVLAATTRVFGLPDPVFLRASPRNGCITNYLIPCTGVPKGYNAGPCFSATVKKNPQQDWWNTEVASRVRFEQLWLLANTARFNDNSALFPYADLRIIAVKNKVLKFIADTAALGIGPDGGPCLQGEPGCTRFDRLDRFRLNRNSTSGVYIRGWGGTNQPVEARPEITGVFGDCRMRNSGCQVECSLHIDGIEIVASVVSHMVRFDDDENRYSEPHIRIAIRAKMSVFAKPLESCFLDSFADPPVRTFLTIQNPDGKTAETQQEFLDRCDPDPVGTPQVTDDGWLLAAGAGAIASTVSGAFDDWPNQGYARVRGQDSSEREIVFYASRTSTSLSVEAGSRGLFGTTQAEGLETDVVEPEELLRLQIPDELEREEWCLAQWEAQVLADGARGVPTVLPVGVDEIEYFGVDGEPIVPPLEVEWLGYLGQASVPSSSDMRIAVAGTTVCQGVLQTFTNLVVNGWPSMVDDVHDAADELYQGSVKVRFAP